MSTKRIADIKPKDRPQPIQIRVVRKWIPFARKPQTVTDICYIFVDTHGDAIEAVADLTDKEYFDSTVKLQQCYIVDKYVSVPSRSYMPAVPHQASLKLGRRATFVPLNDTNIPTYYYNFARYEDLAPRMMPPKLLTDYIGRIESVTGILIRGGKKMRKVTIQDDSGKVIEITLWEEKADTIQREGTKGKLLAVTSMTVTQYDKKLQLESTTSTTVVVNPPIPNLEAYIHRFQKLQQLTSATPTANHIRLAELQKNQNSNTRYYTCTARITTMHASRGWFYANCPVCNLRAYQEEGDTYVCKNDEIDEPLYMYCLNTTITDESGSVEAVFYNEAMTDMLKTPCREMVVTEGHKDSKELPDEITSMIGATRLLHIAVKKDGIVAVNKVEEIEATGPATPDPKALAKRNVHPPSGEDAAKRATGPA